MKLSIIIPVYNEKDTILNVLDAIEKVHFQDGVNKEIIIVDDCSVDGTVILLKKIQEKYNIVFQEKNSGKGSAIRRGLEESSGDVVIIQDADLEYDPEDIPSLLEPVLQGEADVVYGSRFLKKKHIPRYKIYYLGNKVLSWLFSLVYAQKISDVETCYKLFKKEVLKNIKLNSDKFDIEPEITAKIIRQGYLIKELPISYNSRSFEEGKKIGWKDGVVAIYTILKYRFIK